MPLVGPLLTILATMLGEFARLKQQGKIRAIGVCNATTSIMDQYRSIAPLDRECLQV